MLHKAHSLIGVRIHATDGEMGHIEDFYFDDAKWTIRYLIVRTGSWFSGKHLMLAPSTISDVVWEKRRVSVNLSQEQIKKSPDLTMEMPVTREQELDLVQQLNYPDFWSGTPGPIDSAISTMGLAATGVPGMGVAPVTGPTGIPNEVASDIYSTDISNPTVLGGDPANTPQGEVSADVTRAAQAGAIGVQLHEVKRLTGFQVMGSDAGVGKVSDFMIDDANWQVPSLLVDTTAWWPGGEVLVATDLVAGINPSRSQIRINATRDQVKSSPEYKG
jgi:sporulation protein YlmC with PRC-barrel domain